jgi:hypothetical protein
VIVHTNTIENVFSVFKRGMVGVYQHCGEAHLHRYLPSSISAITAAALQALPTVSGSTISFAAPAGSASPLNKLTAPLTPKRKAAAFMRWRKRTKR